jgi:carboxyl-terminal processing protease
MTNKKVQVWLPLLFSLTMIVGMYLGYYMRDNMPGKHFFSKERRRPVQEIMDLVQTKYVDEVNMDSVADAGIQAMLNKLDPHTVFIPAEDLQEVNEDIDGKFFGIGIEFNIINDTLNVVQVLKDGPSQKAGMEVGDKFIKVDDSLVAGTKIDSDRARKLLRGDLNTKVNISVLRNNVPKVVTVTRGIIPLKSVDAAYMIDATVGYIRLNKFSVTTYKEFMTALTDLNKKGLQKLVLDLRDNGGGVLDEAIEIADEFLEGDKLITYTEGKHLPKKEYRCRRQGQFEKGALVVLADENTASASEVLLGALQDWDRATIVGRRTFGKGLVQDQYDLSDGSALRLTIARYYTPIGRSIQRSYKNGEKAYYDEVSNRFNDGETQFADSVKNDTSKVYKTKNGKKVYGGGGITPDYFVALDTSGFTKNTAHVYSKGIINDFVYQYYLQNKAQLAAYKNVREFSTNFILTDASWKQFVTLATKDSVNLQAATAKEKESLTKVIKATLARQLWRNDGYFEVLNLNDVEMKKALEVLK